MESLGLLSWHMLLALENEDIEQFQKVTSCLHDFLCFYGVFKESLVDCYKEISEINKNVDVKLSGAGFGGNILVFGNRDEVEKIEDGIIDRGKYNIHYSSNKNGWQADSLSVIEIKKIGNEIREIEAKVVEKKEAYARMWTLNTIDTKNGESIFKKQYEKIMKRNIKGKIPLLIIKHDGIRRLFVYGKKEEFTTIRLDLLEYILKNKGYGGSQINLLEKVWRDRRTVREIKEELSKEEPSKVYIQEKLSKVRNEIDSLNKFLFKNFESKFLSHGKGQYRLNNYFDR